MDVKTASAEELLTRANQIRRGADEDPNVAFAIAKRLANLEYLEHARRLAEHIHDDPRFDPNKAIELRQKWALWTSKNPDAPDDTKHEEALAILDRIATLPGGKPLADTTDPETLGIAGGICKRLWMVDGQIGTLERSLRFYERGAAGGPVADNGYTSVNAAFVHDLLASLEGQSDGSRRSRARELRQQVLDMLLPIENEPAYPGGPARQNERWFHEIIAEAYFGLADYAKATERLKRTVKGEPWELETTARQFAWLAHLQDPLAKTSQDFSQSAPWKVLRDCFGDSTTAGAGSLFAGKLGLALSGGGFRASFFHVGVLAALAELDLLRHVEVLSCVSGGSILGAHYYLEVRKLLQDHRDQDINRGHYIEIIERMAREFLAGVQKNIRTRVASNLWATLRMLLLPGYTRTNRLGELYEKHLYARILDADGQGRRERRLRELIVRPKGNEDCRPKYDNWRRSNKVPILVINATSVNTGHNWQFTATWMGEPPSRIESEIDGNYRLRRMYLATEAPGKHKDISIGQAVAASSSVPGLFPPLELRDLYEGTTVRLVDGGVHDNQGISGLLDQNCSGVIISDASGQMSSIDNPGDGAIGTLMRSSSILSARVRIAEYRELDSRKKSGRLKGLLFLHLKEGLEVRDKDWVGCDNPKELSADQLKAQAQQLTGYNILKSFQEEIADIRTDLDSFGDVEAYALMASGYNMTRSGVGSQIVGFPTDPRRHDWAFLRMAPLLSSPAELASGRLVLLLKVARHRAFKVWRLSPILKALAIVMGLAAIAGLSWVGWQWRGEPFLSPRGIGAGAATTGLSFLLGGLGLGAIVRVIQYRKTIHQILAGIGLTVVGAATAWVHLLLFDRAFLRRERLN